MEDSSSFWQYIENVKTNSNKLIVMEYNGVELATGDAIVNGFAKYLSSVYSNYIVEPSAEEALKGQTLAGASGLKLDRVTELEILFCTLNTHKIDMTKLLGGQIGLDDFIFVHRKGRPKEIELRKTEESLGLTITDNGSGYAFIKRIKEGSIIDGIEFIQVGDHIERINTENLVGRRHFEVAKMLKEIPRDSVFTIRLVEPLKAGFANIDTRGNSRRGKKQGYGSGKETLRLKADGSALVQQVSCAMEQGIDSINQLLEGFMGINDTELATQIWEHAEEKSNSMDFADAIDGSDLEEFGFTDDFIIELWGAVTDARSGRLKSEVF